MNTLDAIFSRMSVRSFSNKAVEQEKIHTILKAGMSGPSCRNSRDWAFLVVNDSQLLLSMAEANGAPATPLKHCAFGIMVLGDYEKAFSGCKDYWVIDGAIATQNMILAARDLGIGSVWLGTYPQLQRIDAQRKLWSIPDHLIPHSIVAFGYPEDGILPHADRVIFEAENVFYNGFSK